MHSLWHKCFCVRMRVFVQKLLIIITHGSRSIIPSLYKLSLEQKKMHGKVECMYVQVIGRRTGRREEDVQSIFFSLSNYARKVILVASHNGYISPVFPLWRVTFSEREDISPAILTWNKRYANWLNIMYANEVKLEQRWKGLKRTHQGCMFFFFWPFCFISCFPSKREVAR